MHFLGNVRRLLISIHALLAESDITLAYMLQGLQYFYPRSPCGERHCNIKVVAIHNAFLSTLSLRRATQKRCLIRFSTFHFYPRSPCGERRYLINTYHRFFGISIHALLAESDVGNWPRGMNPLCISIHALLAESDRPTANNATTNYEFLSTLSLRRATMGCYIIFAQSITFLSTLSLRRATFPVSAHRFDGGFLSTLSLRRATLRSLQRSSTNFLFLSTLSLRRATDDILAGVNELLISIHALLAESDPAAKNGSTRSNNFYPRSPCGERHAHGNTSFIQVKFLSTLSLRRATGILVFCGPQGSDFYPRSPCGERRRILT